MRAGRIFALRIPYAAHQIHRIEVCGRLHQRHVFGGYLARFGDLERFRAVGVGHPERAAARFALVAHHPADADRSVEYALQQCSVVVPRELDAEPFFDELGNRCQVVRLFFQRFQMGERLGLQVEQDAGQRLFIAYRVAAAGIGRHVVDVLDEYEVGIDFREVFD